MHEGAACRWGGVFVSGSSRLEQEARIRYAQADHLIEAWPLKPVCAWLGITGGFSCELWSV
jgi:hypothetical protein